MPRYSLSGPGIVLPTVYVLGTETERLNNLVEHTSIEFEVSHLQEKQLYVVATEAVVAGVPGNLNVWVELSPVLSTTNAAYWAAIGGGGNGLAPVAPVVEVATGVNLAVHGILIPWSIHSRFARVVVQVPVAAAPLTAFWEVQVVFDAKG